MKFVQALTSLVVLATTSTTFVDAGDCDDHYPCLSFESTKILNDWSGDPSPCVGTKICDFWYELTITVDTSLPGCAKAGAAFDHVCWQTDSDSEVVCPSDDPSAPGFWEPEASLSNLVTKYVVPPGGTIYFATGDGPDGSCDGDSKSYAHDIANTGYDTTVECQGYDSAFTNPLTLDECSGTGECIFSWTAPGSFPSHCYGGGDKCDDAYPCLTFDALKVKNDWKSPPVCGYQCDFWYELTITVDTSLPGCEKAGDAFDHVCWQTDSDSQVVCPSTDPSAANFWAPEEPKSSLVTNYVVTPGATIYFATKGGDDGGCDGDAKSYFIDIENTTYDTYIECEGYNSAFSGGAELETCSGGATGTGECVFSFTAPGSAASHCRVA